MFANFELWSGGLVEAETKGKHVRSSRGCLTCRKRKKKCDEKKPVCQKCSSLAIDCVWQSDSVDGGRMSREGSVGRKRSRSLSTSSDYSVSSASNSPLPTSSSPIPNALFSNLGLVTKVARSLPSCNVLELIGVFDRAIHGAYVSPQYSMLSQTFPVMTESGTLLVTAISCGAALVSQKQSSWEPIALEHHNRALAGLANDIRDNSVMASESILATIMLLHLFEKFGKSPERPKLVHLEAAQRIFASAFHKRIPENIHQTLLIEALLYRVSINSTFSKTVLPSYYYLSNLISTWSKSPLLKFNIIGPWRESVWAGIPPELFDIIYKSSYLLHRMKLPDHMDLSSEHSSLTQRLNALEMQYDLRLLQPFAENGEVRGSPRTAWPSSTSLNHRCVHELYLAASRLLLVKLSKPHLQAKDQPVREIFGKVLSSLPPLSNPILSTSEYSTTDNLPSPNLESNSSPETFSPSTELTQPGESPLLLYPLAILGTAAVSLSEKETMISHVRCLLHICGDRAVNSVLDFLAHAWFYDDGDESTGLQFSGVWEQDDELATGSSVQSKDFALGLDIFHHYDILEKVVV